MRRQLKFILTGAELVEPVPLRIENADAAGFFLAQINSSVIRNRNRQRSRETVMHSALLAERIEDHHAARRRIGDVNVPSGIGGDARRAVKLLRDGTKRRGVRRGSLHGQRHKNEKHPDS